jgi:hypothetical protein
MNAKESTPTIWIQREVGPLLMLRSTVKTLFDKLESVEQDRVILDFSNVEFMSRSFADEYLTAKKLMSKRIAEQHLPLEVRRMLEIVGNPSASTPARGERQQPSSARPRSTVL